ncbi:MAG: hypothetical protein Aurels2KO_29300 [Aureliella sp.]
MLIEITLGINAVVLLTAFGSAAEKYTTHRIGYAPSTGTPLHALLTLVFYVIALIVAVAYFIEYPAWIFIGTLYLLLTISSVLAHIFAGAPRDQAGPSA